LADKRKRGVLLATIIKDTDGTTTDEVVQHILEKHELTNKFIFIFSDAADEARKVITFNTVALSPKDTPASVHFTIRVHRKKSTSTIYTINGLNKALELQHDGKSGRDLKLDWEAHQNCALLTFGGELKRVELALDKILEVTDEPLDEPEVAPEPTPELETKE
jgi:hypothetical protein